MNESDQILISENVSPLLSLSVTTRTPLIDSFLEDWLSRTQRRDRVENVSVK